MGLAVKSLFCSVEQIHIHWAFGHLFPIHCCNSCTWLSSHSKAHYCIELEQVNPSGVPGFPISSKLHAMDPNSNIRLSKKSGSCRSSEENNSSKNYFCSWQWQQLVGGKDSSSGKWVSSCLHDMAFNSWHSVCMPQKLLLLQLSALLARAAVIRDKKQ